MKGKIQIYTFSARIFRPPIIYDHEKEKKKEAKFLLDSYKFYIHEHVWINLMLLIFV